MPYDPNSTEGKAIVAFCADKKMPYELDSKMMDEYFKGMPVDGHMPKHNDSPIVAKKRFALPMQFRGLIFDLIGGGTKDNRFSDRQLENPNAVEDPFDRIQIEQLNSAKKALEQIREKQMDTQKDKEPN